MERLPSPSYSVLAGLWSMLMASGLVFGQGQAAAYLVAPIARNPCTVCPKWSFTLLSFAFMESLCIYGLVIALAILFANQCTLVSCTSVCALSPRSVHETATFQGLTLTGSLPTIYRVTHAPLGSTRLSLHFRRHSSTPSANIDGWRIGFRRHPTDPR